MRKTATKAQAKAPNKVQTKEEAPGWRRPGYPSAKEAPADKLPIKEALTDKLPAVAPATPNPWSQYGASASNVTYEFLKFSKGEYLAGKDGFEIAIGTHMVVDMDSLEVGWIKWEDSRPVQRLLGRIADGFTAAKRDELGDTDKENWPLDDDDEPKDPWQFTNQVTMANTDGGAVYMFTTSSRGGLNAIGVLSKAYGELLEQHSNDWPIIELNVGSYQHSNRAYGRIKFPIFDIVGWAPKDATKVAA
jgi:hypothetical protein